MRPVGASPIERRGVVRDMDVRNIEAEDGIQEIEDNLQILVVGVSNISIDDLPRRYQHHTTGVYIRFGRLLHRVACVVMCYHEHEDYPIGAPSFFYYI